MRRLNLAAAVFVGLAVEGIVYAVDIMVRHGSDPLWPPHARYHVIVSGLHIIAMAAMTAVAAIGGLRKARRSAWIALAIIATMAWGAWPIARLVAGEPPSPIIIAATSGAFIAAAVALAATFKPCFRPETERR